MIHSFVLEGIKGFCATLPHPPVAPFKIISFKTRVKYRKKSVLTIYLEGKLLWISIASHVVHLANRELL